MRFLLALALKTGHVSPRKMLGEMSLRELATWAALWRIDPWGEERADLRSAITSYVVAESRRDPQKKSTPFRPLDFMPYADTAKGVVGGLAEKIKSVMKRFPKKG